jgi:sulfatase maturation enzyme AslB (radical SAM superfamily)
VLTNNIFGINNIIYEIVDDYGFLSEDEIIKKYNQFSPKCISEALKAITQIPKILKSHKHIQTPKVEGILLHGKKYTLDEFLASYSRMLILELTQKCNLACKYCCYTSCT